MEFAPPLRRLDHTQFPSHSACLVPKAKSVSARRVYPTVVPIHSCDQHCNSRLSGRVLDHHRTPIHQPNHQTANFLRSFSCHPRETMSNNQKEFHLPTFLGYSPPLLQTDTPQTNCLVPTPRQTASGASRTAHRISSSLSHRQVRSPHPTHSIPFLSFYPNYVLFIFLKKRSSRCSRPVDRSDNSRSICLEAMVFHKVVRVITTYRRLRKGDNQAFVDPIHNLFGNGYNSDSGKLAFHPSVYITPFSV